MEIHQNYGHASISRLETITKNIPSKTKTNFECIHCVKNKITKSTFKGKSVNADKPFEKLDLNLMGPLKLQSNGGHQFILTLVDSATGYIGAIPLVSKEETPKVLIDLIEKEHQQRGHYPAEVCSNGGSKFVNKKLRNFYNGNHICQIISETYHPEHNGKAERAKRTIVKSTRTILKDACLPAKLWNKVIKSSALMLNQIPREGHPDLPWSKLHGHFLPPSYLKPIGSPYVYLLTQQEKGHKFKEKGEEGALVGFNPLFSLVLHSN